MKFATSCATAQSTTSVYSLLLKGAKLSETYALAALPCGQVSYENDTHRSSVGTLVPSCIQARATVAVSYDRATVPALPACVRELVPCRTEAPV